MREKDRRKEEGERKKQEREKNIARFLKNNFLF